MSGWAAKVPIELVLHRPWQILKPKKKTSLISFINPSPHTTIRSISNHSFLTLQYWILPMSESSRMTTTRSLCFLGTFTIKHQLGDFLFGSLKSSLLFRTSSAGSRNMLKRTHDIYLPPASPRQGQTTFLVLTSSRSLGSHVTNHMRVVISAPPPRGGGINLLDTRTGRCGR